MAFLPCLLSGGTAVRNPVCVWPLGAATPLWRIDCLLAALPAQDRREMRSLSSVLVVKGIVSQIAGPDIKNLAKQCRLNCLLEDFNRTCAISLDNDLSVYFCSALSAWVFHPSATSSACTGARSYAAPCAVRLKVQCVLALSYTRFWDALGRRSNQLAPGEFAASNRSLSVV